jgi:hypothetical protein
VLTNKDRSSEETITYPSGTSTAGSSEQQEAEVTREVKIDAQVTGEVKIEREYGVAKPRRKVVRAKIFPK